MIYFYRVIIKNSRFLFSMKYNHSFIANFIIFINFFDDSRFDFSSRISLIFTNFNVFSIIFKKVKKSSAWNVVFYFFKWFQSNHNSMFETYYIFPFHILRFSIFYILFLILIVVVLIVNMNLKIFLLNKSNNLIFIKIIFANIFLLKSIYQIFIF